MTRSGRRDLRNVRGEQPACGGQGAMQVSGNTVVSFTFSSTKLDFIDDAWQCQHAIHQE